MSTRCSAKTNKKKFTGNLNWPGQTTMFFIIEEVKKTV